MSQLTAGAISKINNGQQLQNINLQVLSVRKFPTGDRCRLLVSDGVHSCGFAILSSQMNPMVENGEIAINCVVQIIRYYCNEVAQKKKMMIILELKVLRSATEVGSVIGSPQPYDADKEAGAPKPAAPTVNGTRSPLVSRNGPNTVASTAPATAPQGFPNIRPIDSLTPYQNKWTICARVTSKGNIRTWSNAKGEGKLFSMDLLDESGEIRATAFNAECDKFNEMVEVNKVYFISVASLKTANKQYSNLKNDYEMTFNQGTQMVPCHEESSIPAMQFDFITLEQLEKVAKDTLIDCVGVCQTVADVSVVTQKSTGKELKKREVIIVDNTNRSVNMTLWGETAEKFEGSGNPVLAIKGAKVSDFGGVSLSLTNNSTMQINPDITEAHQLKGWWESSGSTASITCLSTGRGSGQGMGANAVYKTFEEVRREGLGNQSAPDYYTCKATVSLVRKENILYTACANENCNKKVMDMSNGMYRCEKCNQEFDSFKWRLMVQCNVADFTSNMWISMFQENAELMFGTTAQEMGRLRDESPDEFRNILSSVTFKDYVFKLRVKMETFNDESRLKTNVMNLAAVTPLDYNKRLIKEIREMAPACN